MATSNEIQVGAPVAVVGTTLGVMTAADVIPDGILAKDVLAIVPGPQAQILRVVDINDLPDGGKQIVFSNLAQPGRRVYTLAELNAIRPLGFFIPDRPWGQYEKFVEGGLYQAWPNGQLFRVRNKHLVDAYQGVRVYAAKDRDKLPALLSVFVPRWVPRRVVDPVVED